MLGAEQAADDAFLHPLGPDRQIAVGREARDLGAGPGAAGRPVVGPAGTKDEIPAAGAGLGRGTEQGNMVDLGETRVRHRLAHADAIVGELGDIIKLKPLAVFVDHTKPVAAPGEITAHVADAGQIDRQRLFPAVARYVVERHHPAGCQHRHDHASRGVEFHQARLEQTRVSQRHDHTDGAVAAHTEKADVVEEDDAELTRLVVRLDQERPDGHVRAARLTDDGRAKLVVLLPEHLHPFRQRPAAQIRAALEHKPGRFAAGVRINDLDLGEGGHRWVVQ